MKLILAVLLCVAATQAVEWSRARPIYRTMPPVKYIPRSTVNSGRIVGGSEATRHQFPYQVGIWINGNGFCGGSLIAPQVVLTAAHCADGGGTFDVELAAHEINNNAEPDRQSVRSTDAVVHSAWNSNTLNNDIAIIRLPSAVSGTGIGEVRMPSRAMAGQTFEGVTATVSGWGRVSDSNPSISPVLKSVDATVMSNADCRSYYGSTINTSKICIDTQGGAASTCNGDSGGPLVITEGDGIATEVGVVSFGSSAGCESGAPAAFTRVTEFLDWIETNAGIPIRP